jgi:hypothetical protein
MHFKKKYKKSLFAINVENGFSGETFIFNLELIAKQIRIKWIINASLWRKKN